MSVMTYEAIVEQGQIRLPVNVSLPERAKIYVVVPDTETKQVFSFASPRLVHPEQAADFVKEVIEEPYDAEI